MAIVFTKVLPLIMFKFKILTQEGKVGFVPDYYSRIHALLGMVKQRELLGADSSSGTESEGESVDMLLEMESSVPKSNESPDHYISLVHGGRSFHHGERRTWLLLNRRYPGHAISYAYVAEYVAKCSTCQKN